jgi:hypothetical protein
MVGLLAVTLRRGGDSAGDFPDAWGLNRKDIRPIWHLKSFLCTFLRSQATMPPRAEGAPARASPDKAPDIGR